MLVSGQIFIYSICKKLWLGGCGSEVMNPAGIHEESDSIPGPAQWVKDPWLP